MSLSFSLADLSMPALVSIRVLRTDDPNDDIPLRDSSPNSSRLEELTERENSGRLDNHYAN